MNSFVKKNGVLVGVLALSGIAALTLLIFIFINLFGLFDKIDETRQASDRAIISISSTPILGSLIPPPENNPRRLFGRIEPRPEKASAVSGA